MLSTVLGLLLAAPAAYAMAFFKGKYTKDILMWMLSTKMMPAVGALVPIYVLAQKSHLLDTQLALIIVFALSNLPIMVWMLYSHFKDIPREILEAARMDGATLWQEVRLVLLPLGMGGLASTGLLCLVLSWNEAFWSLNLSAAKAGTLATLIASYSSPEGLFWAKLSAASLMAIAPIVVFGWFSQKQLVQGLTFGAVTGLAPDAPSAPPPAGGAASGPAKPVPRLPRLAPLFKPPLLADRNQPVIRSTSTSFR